MSASATSPSDAASYYGRPILKEHIWKPAIAWYFFLGGLAGASSAVAAAASIAGNEPLRRRAVFTSLAGYLCSPPLLIYDLGRPERFVNMLRVFKVTSPMSVGTWILAAAGTCNGGVAGLELLGRAPRAKQALTLVGGALGPPVSTYTAALIADTAVPVWHEARRELPLLFAASSAASAGGILAALTPVAAAAPVRRLAVGGALAQLGILEAMDRRLGFLAEPYRKPPAAIYSKLARACTIGGAAVLALAGRNRAGAVAGGVLVAAGAAAERFAVFNAGSESARDPRYTVEPQKRRLAERE